MFRRHSVPGKPALADLRLQRAARRRQALIDLLAPPRSTFKDVTGRSRPHEVYLLHFPAEGRFKVGLTHSISGRIDYFVRHGGVIVDQVSVDSRSLAEVIEADVLALIEDWHRLGDWDRPGSGYTEMWADDGPTVDLEGIKRRAILLVSDLRNVLDGETR